jgi:hypothetical protein
MEHSLDADVVDRIDLIAEESVASSTVSPRGC